MNEDPRVLVIVDDEALRGLVIRIVKQAGYQVRCRRRWPLRTRPPSRAYL
jgi:DNA-binding NtrC family response regulator